MRLSDVTVGIIPAPHSHYKEFVNGKIQMIRTCAVALAITITSTTAFADIIPSDQTFAPTERYTPVPTGISAEQQGSFNPLLQGFQSFANTPDWTAANSGNELWTDALQGQRNAGSFAIPNPVICSLVEQPDGTVSGSCAPINPPTSGPVAGGANGVPAPGGLLLMLAAAGFALRKKFTAA